MTRKEFSEMLITTEPLITFRGEDYQICSLYGKFLLGYADTEEHDEWFDSVDDLIDNGKLGDVPLRDALPEISFS